MSEGLKKYSDFLEDELVILRVAHQPNLFPYFGILAQFLLLNRISMILAKKYRSIALPIFLIVDYDVSGDSRFKTAHYLNTSRKEGIINLSAEIDKRYYNTPMYLTPKPSISVVDYWLKSVSPAIKNELHYLHSIGIYDKDSSQLNANTKLMSEDVWDSFKRAKNFSEFNSYFLSRTINLRFGLPILFIPGSSIHELYQKTWNFYLKHMGKIQDATLRALSTLNSRGVKVKYKSNSWKFPFWYICDYCKERIGLRNVSGTEVRGECRKCGREYSFEVSGIFSQNKNSSSFLPSVIIDDLSDTLALNASGGVSYIGGGEHILISNLVAKTMGFAVFHQAVWQPKMITFGISEMAALLKAKSLPQDQAVNLLEKVVETCKGKTSILYYISNFKPKSLLDSWNIHFEKNLPFARVNYDPSLCPMSFKPADFHALILESRKLLISCNSVNSLKGNLIKSGVVTDVPT